MNEKTDNAAEHVAGLTEDPFMRQFAWIVDRAGGVPRVKGIKSRTAYDWLAGRYPKDPKVRHPGPRRVDDWALATLPGYPPEGEDGQRRHLADMCGPNTWDSARSQAEAKAGRHQEHGGRPRLSAATPASSSEPTDGSKGPSVDRDVARAGGIAVELSRPKLLGIGAVGAGVLVIVAVFVTGLIGPGVGPFSDDGRSSGSSAGRGSADPNGVVPQSLPPKAGLTVEVSAGHRGAPLFADPEGTAVPAGKLTRIPYGDAVYVKCRVTNKSEMASVAAFYFIQGGKYNGLYAVSNSFTNGDKFGITGGHNVDLKIPAC